MNIPEDLQLYIGEQLSLGYYESLDEIITEALTLLRDKRQAELYEQIDIGRRQIENGECVVLKDKADRDAFVKRLKQGIREPETCPAN